MYFISKYPLTLKSIKSIELADTIPTGSGSTFPVEIKPYEYLAAVAKTSPVEGIPNNLLPSVIVKIYNLNNQLISTFPAEVNGLSYFWRMVPSDLYYAQISCAPQLLKVPCKARVLLFSSNHPLTESTVNSLLPYFQ